ncbi:MAG: hypothetical protein LBI06_07750 [Treponema sp.]|jgi:hypothetical protein|nr:hypothetical protein [Treponema sp.]
MANEFMLGAENADNWRMGYINFEDIIFILNMRIRTVRDILRLNPPPELFMEKSLDDLAFIDHILTTLTNTLMANGDYNGRSVEFDYVSDSEWQFNQLLTEFILDSGPFSIQAFPEITERIAVLRSASDLRRKSLDESDAPVEIARSEPVVSSAEMNGLLGAV